MIPKIIHFVWVGNAKKSDDIIKCINSWKKYLPDYEIIEWGNESLSDIDNLYVKQAYENKKWAFVSDYLRLYALSNYGGFYFDTDLEITKSIDEFRDYKFVMGYEVHFKEVNLMTAFIGADKDCAVIDELLQLYEGIEFINNGEMDQTTNVIRFGNYFEKKYDFKKPYNKDLVTYFEEKIVVFPSHFFCTPEKDKVNYSIHHFNASWVDAWLRRKLLSVGNYKIVRYKKNKNFLGDDMPIFSNEKLIFELSISSNRKYCILKEL